MECLNPTAENVETDLQTPTIPDLLPETITPAKQAGKSGRAKAPTTAENVEIDLQTSAISDLLPETTTPAKQAGKSGRAKAPTPAPALKRDSDGNEFPVDQTLAEYILKNLAEYIALKILKIAGNDPDYKAEFEKSQFIFALRLNQACDQLIKGINSQLRGFALKLAREWETVSPNPNPIQSSMIIIPCAYLD